MQEAGRLSLVSVDLRQVEVDSFLLYMVQEIACGIRLHSCRLQHIWSHTTASASDWSIRSKVWARCWHSHRLRCMGTYHTVFKDQRSPSIGQTLLL